jgi:hypothetical protein
VSVYVPKHRADIDPDKRFPDYREGETCQGCGGAKCILDCDRPNDQFEPRYCGDCEKYQSTCANDHCLVCGAST